VEAFHSSGWGTTPAEVVGALNEDFACGATFINLHGLYYTTRGGWWEWAPPDFHFRQPYWGHCRALNDYLTRLSWLLSQGAHRCDVAVLYPSAALEAEPAAYETPPLHVHTGHNVIEESDVMSADPEQVAFRLGKYLFDRACDFDFIDFEALNAATTIAGELRVSGEVYRALILPAMKVVRHCTLLKALDFVRAGGLVIACGCLPETTERSGANDPRVEELLAELFNPSPRVSGGRGILVSQDFARVLQWINELTPRDVATSAWLHVLHRSLESQDVFYVFNPASVPAEPVVHFRTTGEVESWDAWNGRVTPLAPIGVSNGVTTLRVALGAREAKVVVFQRDFAREIAVNHTVAEAVNVIAFNDLWDFQLQPTMDNTFGDFRLPATAHFIGPEARRFRFAEETAPSIAWSQANFDDSAWPETTYSFGPRFEVLGPFPPDAEHAGPWRPYSFSLRWGVERDPFLTNWTSGPHGLKNHVPDDFLDFCCEFPGHVWWLRAEVNVDADREVTMLMGGRCAYQAWLNERLVLEQSQSLPPGRHKTWNIPHYECCARPARVKLRKGVNHLKLKLVQPEGQRARAFIAFDPPPVDTNHLGLRWFKDHVPRPSLPATPDRRAVWLRCIAPPGLRGLQFVARGPARAWADGQEFALEVMEILVDGSLRYRSVSESKHAGPVQLALRIEAPLEYRAGDVVPEPVRFECRPGQLPVGDWCAHGLATYSGMAEYRQSLVLDDWPRQGRFWLDLGDLAATAEVRWNGILAGVLTVPPWRVDVTELIQAGINTVSIQVANTLANHYSVGIPTPYAFPHQTRSGLFGPVRLIQTKI
jgi:hypothetical protein